MCHVTQPELCNEKEIKSLRVLLHRLQSKQSQLLNEEKEMIAAKQCFSQ